MGIYRSLDYYLSIGYIGIAVKTLTLSLDASLV
ncbi:hypothetical protein PthstB1num2_33520 [Parageobacillus thermoglucosidasius]|nr:hypothetical protein PthstB1num2_33520 [Parageobacillus thermoglucosidasius]